MIIEHRYVLAHDMEQMRGYFYDAAGDLYLRIIWLDGGAVIFPQEVMSMKESVASINDQIEQKWPLLITDRCDVTLFRSCDGVVLYPKNANDFWKRLKNAMREPA